LGTNELNNKSEWSALQYIEQKNRDLGSDSRLMFEQSDAISPYRMVGVRNDATKQWIWILLNPRHPPFYKQLPAEGVATITPSEFERIVKEGAAHPVVQEKLKKMMKP
jgi:hypothetical protein